jgi:hypothetical protein
MTARWIPAALLTLAALAVTTPALAQQQKPSLNAGRITGEVLAGTYVGIGAFLVGRVAAENLSDALRVESDRTRNRIGITTGAVVSILATAGVVYGIGNIGNETGDYDATVMGTTAGFAVALTAAHVLIGPGLRPPSGSSTAARWATVNALALLPAAGAAVGFASTRRYK